MSRQKKKRFADNLVRDNVIEPGKPIYESIKGRWHGTVFDNSNPIVIELGCGKGEYTIGLAAKFPMFNFVGVDLKGDRIWVGSGKAIEQKLFNVAFLRTQILQLGDFFQPGEIDEMWLTFPDPRPKDRDEKRRLTFPKYMEVYGELLKQDGWFKFKTDNTDLFEYTLEILQENIVTVKNLEYTHDLYNSPLLEEHHGIKTKYEEKFTELGETIKYMKFQFD